MATRTGEMGLRVKYERSKPFSEGASLSRRRHLKEQYEINNFYWTSTLCSDIASHDVKKYATASAPDLLDALGYNSDSRDRIVDSQFVLKERLSTAGRWLRLTTLVMATSAFERFLVGVTESALESDPTISTSWPKRVDGLMLKKYGLDLTRPSTEGLVHGVWSKRMASYRAIFGDTPSCMQANISELDKIRKARNSFAHEFGYESRSSEVGFASALNTLNPHSGVAQVSSVSQARLVSWLSLLNDLSREIDKTLVERHIGGFEPAAIYLEWRNDPTKFEKSVGVALKEHRLQQRIRFRHAVADFFPPFGDEYYQSMLAYVDGL